MKAIVRFTLKENNLSGEVNIDINHKKLLSQAKRRIRQRLIDEGNDDIVVDTALRSVRFHVVGVRL